jgi:hypothetical protein
MASRRCAAANSRSAARASSRPKASSTLNPSSSVAASRNKRSPTCTSPTRAFQRRIGSSRSPSASTSVAGVAGRGRRFIPAGAPHSTAGAGAARTARRFGSRKLWPCSWREPLRCAGEREPLHNPPLVDTLAALQADGRVPRGRPHPARPRLTRSRFPFPPPLRAPWTGNRESLGLLSFQRPLDGLLRRGGRGEGLHRQRQVPVSTPFRRAAPARETTPTTGNPEDSGFQRPLDGLLRRREQEHPVQRFRRYRVSTPLSRATPLPAASSAIPSRRSTLVSPPLSRAAPPSDDYCPLTCGPTDQFQRP